jgi:hypothetical protein
MGEDGRAIAFHVFVEPDAVTAAVDRVSTTIWSGGAAAGLYLGTGLILAFLVHTHYPGVLGLREWIRVVLSWPLIFFLRSK